MKTIALGLLALMLGTIPTDTEISGVRFPDSVNVYGQTLLLNGAGVRCVTLLCVKVYVAGLYVRERTTSAADILRDDRPKYVTAVMKRDMSRADAAEAFRKGIERAAGSDAGAIRGEIARLEQWIPAMREKDQMTVFFNPGSGVTIWATPRSDTFQGNAAFGTALFGMWIGPRAVDSDLRAAMLKGR
jgi:hypothetical protein